MSPPTTIAYLTAGAAGMFCGSCLHDNTLARALVRRGIDAQLIPLYTPIRTDEQDVSVDRVFYGGINVFLQEKVPLFRYLPSFVSRLLDQPWLLRWATSRGIETDAKMLGALTVSMLQGTAGHQRKADEELCHWLEHKVHPHLINLSNMLIAGCVPLLKRRLQAPIFVTLQGDDIFLLDLVEPYQSRALAEMRRIVADIDGFLVNSRYYADFMGDLLQIPAAKLHLVPLGVDTTDFRNPPAAPPTNPRPLTVGYLARLAPEKGLHWLADAFVKLAAKPGMQQTRLLVAGWLGKQHRTYAEAQFDKLRAAGLSDRFSYLGEVDRHGKVEFLQRIDVLSVPTVYRDPKGLFVLEAAASGVPCVQPAHGAFPELLDRLGCGRLVPPNDPDALADALHSLLTDEPTRKALGHQGRTAVHERFHADAMAAATMEIFQPFLQRAQ